MYGELAREPLALTLLVHTLVIDARRLHFERSGSGRHLSRPALSIAYNQRSTIVLSRLILVDVLGHLRLRGGLEHPSRAFPGDLVQPNSFAVSASLFSTTFSIRSTSPPRRQPRGLCVVVDTGGQTAFFMLPLHNFCQ